MPWQDLLDADPTEWLLEEADPAVRAATLTALLDRPADDPETVAARAAAMTTDPIKGILDAQLPTGGWGRPGPGYTPKYTGTGWQLYFLEQLGADGSDERIRRGCEYLLAQGPSATGGIGTAPASKPGGRPSPSSVLHCFNGLLVRALVGLGHLDDPRVQGAVDWAARSITGEGMARYYASGTAGPGFRCGSNENRPCAWGAVKELMGLSRVPVERRSPLATKAVDQGVDFLLSHDVVKADYPMPSGDAKPSPSWFKLGFPAGYVTDVLQNLLVLAELGRATDERVQPALRWLVQQQDGAGRWRNDYALNGKTSVVIEQQGSVSKWVTLRACTVLRAAYG